MTDLALEERIRARPGRAWLLSLLFPGAGQLYADALTRGGVTMVLFGVAVIVVIWYPKYGFAALHIATLMYAFAGVDAYETARERNRGIDAEAPANPRVAALVNATTNGFGYIYLGQKFGFGAFVALVIGNRVFARVAPVVLPLAVVALAAHAWVIGVREREEAYPLDRFPERDDTRIPMIVPRAVALIIAGALVAIELYQYARITFG